MRSRWGLRNLEFIVIFNAITYTAETKNGHNTKTRRKVLGLAYVKLGKSGRWVGIRSRAGVIATLRE